MTSDGDPKDLRSRPVSEICRLLGERIRQVRKDADETQEALALRAGVPLRTYKRLETEGKATLETFVQVLDALGRTSYLIYLFPQKLPAKAPSLQDKLNQLQLRVHAPGSRTGPADETLPMPRRYDAPKNEG